MTEQVGPVNPRPVYYTLDGSFNIQPVSPAAEPTVHQQGPAYQLLARGNPQDAVVSTVFLGMDLATEGPPVLFETKIWCGGPSPCGHLAKRYSTYWEAIKGHQDTLAAMEQTAEGASL